MGPEGDQGPAGPAGAAGTAKIADGSVTLAKLADATAVNQIIVADASKHPAWVTMSGDVTIVAAGTTTIGDNKVTLAKMADNSVGSAEIVADSIVAADIATGAVATAEILNATILEEDLANNAVTSAKIAADTIVAADIATGAVTTTEIFDGTIQNDDINAAAGIWWSKMDPLTSAWIVVGNVSNVATEVNPGGDVEIDNAGVTTIQANAITGPEITNDAVTVAKIAQGTAGQVLLTDGTPTTAWTTLGGDIASITGAGVVTIADGAVTSAKIALDTILAADIATDAVGSLEIAAGAVGSSELDSNAVSDASKIAAGAVDTSELANNAVTVPKLDYLVVNVTFVGAVNTWSSAPDPTLAGGEILGYYPVLYIEGFTVAGVTLNPATGVVTITLNGLATGPDSFNVVVLRP
jgi:hypothetical protein